MRGLEISFNVSNSELVAILRSMGDMVRWPKEMKSNPIKRNPDFWCEFHNDHGHKITDCRLLQSEVDHLLKQGYLTDLFSDKGRQSYMKNRQEPPKPPSPNRTVNVISGGDEVNVVTYTTAKKTSKLTVTHGKRIRRVLDEDSITFDDADADGSSVNIILLRVVNEMQVSDKVVPKARSLSGFDNSSVITKREIVLTTFEEGVIKDTKLQVIDADMAYNMILGRPCIQDMDDVSSTLYQVIKFPSQWGIRQIRGDQQASKSINSVANSSTSNNVADEK
uniref:Uncharacterized protein n=1 Tax=Nicotiana tabacum TaxID=4097 RepID=A0A1S4CYN1_TOBAC|nr:PREDICTED: uncharacterized protein LOC107823912 [Nicotiana tabacum]